MYVYVCVCVCVCVCVVCVCVHVCKEIIVFYTFLAIPGQTQPSGRSKLGDCTLYLMVCEAFPEIMSHNMWGEGTYMR